MYDIFTLYKILIPITWNVTWFPIKNYIGLFYSAGKLSSACFQWLMGVIDSGVFFFESDSISESSASLSHETSSSNPRHGACIIDAGVVLASCFNKWKRCSPFSYTQCCHLTDHVIDLIWCNSHDCLQWGIGARCGSLPEQSENFVTATEKNSSFYPRTGCFLPA